MDDLVAALAMTGGALLAGFGVGRWYGRHKSEEEAFEAYQQRLLQRARPLPSQRPRVRQSVTQPRSQTR